ncbi:MAG: PH domain-containing protein [Pseudomonadota bacterium]
MSEDSASPTVSVPITARPEDSSVASADAQPQRTAPLGLIVGALSSAQNAIFPAIAVGFGANRGGLGVLLSLAMAGAVIFLGTFMAYLRWKRLTYTIGEQDIRVESGILSRSARSVPYERIQDVSLEQKLLPRLLGLVSVKFETGAGGGDDLALTYLVEAEGERLRELVRERRDDPHSGAETSNAQEKATAPERADEGEALFTMGPRRLVTFGLFEFSLAVFAVLAGLLQYLDTFFEIEIWDVDFWRELAEEQGGWLFELGAYAQALSVIVGLILVVLIGMGTGLFRTFSREWGFRLERTARGFRRRRGLFTRTDVVMPVHRVQGLTIGTRFLRYRFGWHSLKFVSLAQDAGSSSHVVAPFAQLDELDPVVEAAGFSRPTENAEWHRASRAWLNATIAIDLAIFAVAMLIAVGATETFAPEWTMAATLAILAVAIITLVAEMLSWQFKKHALETDQIASVSGLFAPKTEVAKRVKLHSVEIAQGPIGKRCGYATLHLGMAGGEMEIEGVELERARKVRALVLETIAQTDFSQLETEIRAAAA